MKGYKMYTQIKHLKDKGFTRHWVAKQLGIHRKTVSRYWDMPPGKQMQVDFGEERLTRADGKRIKVYFAAFVLSHSRYKWPAISI